jgi:hypothetical protein
MRLNHAHATVVEPVTLKYSRQLILIVSGQPNLGVSCAPLPDRVPQLVNEQVQLARIKIIRKTVECSNRHSSLLCESTPGPSLSVPNYGAYYEGPSQV